MVDVFACGLELIELFARGVSELELEHSFLIMPKVFAVAIDKWHVGCRLLALVN